MVQFSPWVPGSVFVTRALGSPFALATFLRPAVAVMGTITPSDDDDDEDDKKDDGGDGGGNVQTAYICCWCILVRTWQHLAWVNSHAPARHVHR